MKGAILLRPSGTDHPIAPKNGNDFQLHELYALLRCETVEIVSHPHDREVLLVMDEDGKFKHRQINQTVTNFFHNQVVVGDVIMCEKKMIQ